MKKVIKFANGESIEVTDQRDADGNEWSLMAGPDGMWLYLGKEQSIASVDGTNTFNYKARYNYMQIVSEVFLEGEGKIRGVSKSSSSGIALPQ